MKTLVVFFSRKGYVQKLALDCARQTGADIMKLETYEPTRGKLCFWWCGRFGMMKWGMRLKPSVLDPADYDRVIICSPIWVFSVCAPVRQFVLDNAGRIKAADYKLMHFSTPMRYDRAVRWMDETLGIEHGEYESLCCMWGKVFKRRLYK